MKINKLHAILADQKTEGEYQKDWYLTPAEFDELDAELCELCNQPTSYPSSFTYQSPVGKITIHRLPEDDSIKCMEMIRKFNDDQELKNGC